MVLSKKTKTNQQNKTKQKTVQKEPNYREWLWEIMAVQEVMKFTGSDQVKTTGDQNQVGEIEEYRDKRKEEDLYSWTETKDKGL